MKRHNTSIGHEPSKRFQQLPNQERHPRSPEEQTSRRPYDGGGPSSSWPNPLSFFPPSLKLGPYFDATSLRNHLRAFIIRWEDAPKKDLCKGMTTDIWNFFIDNQQTEQVFLQKIELWKTLDELFGLGINCKILAFGSTLNGFGDKSSDLDCCLFFGTNNPSKRVSMDMLFRARKLLRHRCNSFVKGQIEMVPAKVPIIKFYDSNGRIEVDISCNSPLSIKNTHMLHYYGLLDWRVRPLVLCIKTWAKNANIKDAKTQTFSSYTLSLMIINFLQCGVTPSVLPSLQLLQPEVFDSNIPETELTFHMPPPNFQSENSSSLGTLLVNFFDFYANKFDFSSQVASVRTGTILSISACHSYAKSSGLPRGQWEAYVCIEEPFERTNSGRAIVKRDRFDSILYHLKSAWRVLKNDGSLRDLINLKYELKK